MSTSFLFRFDGSRDNDDYLEQGRARGYIVFAGIEMRVNAGWVPDFMRVVLDEPTARCTLTLVELEADANSTRVSARKYLPESASSIVEGFLAYLERASAQCRATADPRHKSIHELITTIRGSQNIAVTTAGALRNQFVFIEELPLIDQAPVDISRPAPEQQSVRENVLQGQTILVPIEHKVLFRTVLILDAVVRGWDKSGASLRAWRNLRSQPLKAAIRGQSESYPELTRLLLSHKTGLRIDVDRVADELCLIWNAIQPKRHSADSVVRAIQRYFPIAGTLPRNARMRDVFDTARPVLADGAG